MSQPFIPGPRRPRPRPLTELLRLLAERARAGEEDIDVAPEELAGLRSGHLGPALLWVTPAWAHHHRVHLMDRLTVGRIGSGLRVDVARHLPTDRHRAATREAYAFLALHEQALRTAHRSHAEAVDTRLVIRRWTRLPRDVVHVWSLSVFRGDALDAYLTALALDAHAQREARAELGACALDDVLAPDYHRWEARMRTGWWGATEPLFDAAERHHGARVKDWDERRRLARVAIATGRVRNPPEPE